MIKIIKNLYNLIKLLKKGNIICNKNEIIIEFKESIIHLDNLGNLSIRPKGLILNHCTYQEVLEQNEWNECSKIRR